MICFVRSAVLIVLCLVASQANADFIGTELTLAVLEQSNSASQPVVTSFPRTTTVSATSVEYPDVASLFDPNSPTLPGFAHSLVNTAIDVGPNFITFDFDNAGTNRFATAFKNGYLFTFDSALLPTITGAHVDTSVTTLGLVQSDLIFSGNTLFVNVEGLPFNPNTFARINIDVVGGPTPTPEPSSLLMLLGGMGSLLLTPSVRRRIRRGGPEKTLT